MRLFVNVAAQPAPTTNLLSLVDGHTLSLAWMNGASGGVPSELHLIVQGSANTFVPLPITESITFNNVPAGTYNLWVSAVNRNGNGPNSNGVVVVVPGACTGIPGRPLNVAAVKMGAHISLSWDLPESGPAPTSFVVNVTGSLTGSFPVTARSLAGDVGPGSYTISVASRNSCGTSVSTAPVTVVMP